MELPVSPARSRKQATDGLAVSAPSSAEPVSSRNSPEHDHISPHGHYLGPSSSLALLSRARRRLHSVMPLGEGMSIFAFGDAPLPKTEDLFLHLPSIGEARQLLKTYFDFAFPTHRFLHQPTVEVWLEEFYRNKSSPAIRPGARERFAIVLLVLAHATLYSPNRSTDGRVASDR